MKKLIVLNLLVLLMLSGTKLIAQEYKFGIQGGLVMASAYGLAEETTVPSSTFNPMPSYSVNVYIGYKSAGIWGLSFEPGFIQKGYQQDHVLPGGKETIRGHLHYIQLPVLVDFYIKEKFCVSIGPEFAFFQNAAGKSNKQNNIITSAYDEIFELSGIIGMSYNFHKNFDIGLRYSRAFTFNQEVIMHNSVGMIVDRIEQYNQYAQLFVRFKI